MERWVKGPPSGVRPTSARRRDLCVDHLQETQAPLGASQRKTKQQLRQESFLRLNEDNFFLVPFLHVTERRRHFFQWL